MANRSRQKMMTLPYHGKESLNQLLPIRLQDKNYIIHHKFTEEKKIDKLKDLSYQTLFHLKEIMIYIFTGIG